jgi:hydroxymethylpyrimidine pyrophosphatase-like HAD family hydrolase
MIVAVDFDGTVVKHEYPKVGENCIGAVETLKRLVENKHDIILWTMRHGKELQDAIDWYKKHEIPLYGVNCNPSQSEWTKSPKAYAQLYIDDAALGCPLDYVMNGRPFVDWFKIQEILTASKII